MMKQKQAWRGMAKEMFRLIAAESCRELDQALIRQAEEYISARNATTLLGFAPMPDEPDILALFRRWTRQGRTLAMPVWLGGPNMLLRRADDVERDLRRAESGIWEPKDDCPEIAPEEIDLAVIPGRVFSETRQRLGRGAGCYDRLIRGRTMHRVGVAYDFQIFPAIPASDDDEEMDAVITPSRVVTNRNASR